MLCEQTKKQQTPMALAKILELQVLKLECVDQILSLLENSDDPCMNELTVKQIWKKTQCVTGPASTSHRTAVHTMRRCLVRPLVKLG